MGRSVGGKRHSSASFTHHETGTGYGETSSNFQDPSPQRNVRSLMEKLKQLKTHHDGIMELKSVKAVISALEKRSRADNFPTHSDSRESNAKFASHTNVRDRNRDSDACTAAPSSTKSVMREKQAEVNSDNSKFTVTTRKSQKCAGGGGVGSRSSNPISSSTEKMMSSSASPNDDRLLSAKTGFSKLIRKFENSYKRVAKKYFFMLKPRKPSRSNFFGVFFSILAFIFYFELHTINGFSRLWLKWENVDLGSVECTIESPNLAMELFRPPVSCAICHNVKAVDRVSDIPPSEFERLYAYTGRPVIISDAMKNWTAPNAFSFEFFKGIYSEGSRSLQHLHEDCLFFPYKTEFRSLAEVFNMTNERSQRSWYIGWSNCDAETSHILRQHYQRPYFLPETAESTHADWIFMGTPGHGAHMHIDHVIHPSWQGQIKGIKRWFLQPPPECFYECPSFHVDVFPGDIIVLDTNKWYHQTQILPGENSITIGSEYD